MFTFVIEAAVRNLAAVVEAFVADSVMNVHGIGQSFAARSAVPVAVPGSGLPDLPVSANSSVMLCSWRIYTRRPSAWMCSMSLSAVG